MVRQILARGAARASAAHPRARSLLKQADLAASRSLHAIATAFPAVIGPSPRQLTVAITAHCNLRCRGCRYGRDFMPGEALTLTEVRHLIEDAAEAGVGRVRFYGGEPLLHPELPDMVSEAVARGMQCYVTTNGTHLGLKAPALHAAGLRMATIGFYGTDASYDAYTQRHGHFARLERSLATVRSLFGAEFELQLNFVLMRDSCSLEALSEAWQFALRFDMFFHIDLVNFSAPFFVQDRASGLHLTEADREHAEAVALEMLRLKRADPKRFVHSEAFIRSIPDWLVLGPRMRVPCDAYELLWVGADGTVQLCDVALPLGNIRERRLREMLFGQGHRRAARDGFRLNCPNCTCKVDSRIQKHLPSVRRYSRPLAGEVA